METTIDGVILRLEQGAREAQQRGSRGGYFAALYAQMTRAIRDNIQAGTFDDGPRMERLDVAFANRYFAALDAARSEVPLAQSWRDTFAAEKSDQHLVMQHLLLGINAHINFDLGVATAEITRAEDLASLEDDFMRVNAILSDLIDEIQKRINTISCGFRLIDLIGARLDEAVFQFSLRKSRDWAWQVSQELVVLAPPERALKLTHIDGLIAKLGQKIVHPGLFAGGAIFLLRLVEKKNVARNIEILLG